MKTDTTDIPAITATFARSPGFTEFNTRDGHRMLEKYLPKWAHHGEPRWLGRRCRAFDIAGRKPHVYDDGYIAKVDKKPARYMGQEFIHFMERRGLWYSLFDHWGRMTLPDGRVALHSSPYCDSYPLALRMAHDLGIELLSLPGDKSVYATGAFWYLWAEPLTPAKP